jgi:hypothetical protein
LPIGMQLMADQFEEDLLLSFVKSIWSLPFHFLFFRKHDSIFRFRLLYRAYFELKTCTF